MKKAILSLITLWSSLAMAQNTFPANGNVGIGTTNPENIDRWDRVLEVHGTQHAKSIVSSTNVITGSWSHELGYYGAPAGGIIGTYSNHPFSIIADKNVKMTFLPNGNVGIGTTNPENIDGWNKVLEVHGTQHAKSIVSSTNVITGSWSHELGYYGAPAGGLMGTYSNHPFSIIAAKAVKMTFLPNGNVGIGTVTPKEALSVNGNIRAKEVKVEATNWPDYVFEEGYKVGTLEELETYIKENKHLPGIADAKTIEENGIAVSETIKAQQKIIEELTLHLIEKEKEVKALFTDNANQKKEIANSNLKFDQLLKRLEVLETKIK